MPLQELHADRSCELQGECDSPAPRARTPNPFAGPPPHLPHTMSVGLKRRRWRL